MSIERTGGQFLWAVGGFPNDAPCTDEVSVYNIDEDRWYTSLDGDVAPMPHPVRAAGWTSWEDKFFCFGGKQGGDENCVPYVQVYDVLEDEWTLREEMPAPRSKLGKYYPVVDDRYVYLFGGDDIGGRFSRVNWNWRYDLANDEWDTDVADAPFSQSFPLPTIHDGWLYYLTGNTGSRKLNTYPGAISQRYNPETDEWQVVTPCPFPVTDGDGDKWRGEMHFVGGWNTNPDFYNEDKTNYRGPIERQHFVYDYETNTWRFESPLPGRWHHGGLRGGEEYLWRYLGIIDEEKHRRMTDRIFRWDGERWEEMTPAPLAKMNFGTIHTTVGPRETA